MNTEEYDRDLGAKMYELGYSDKLCSFKGFGITEIIFFEDAMISISVQVFIDNDVYIGSFDYNWGTFAEFMKQIPYLYAGLEKFAEFHELSQSQGTIQIPFDEPVTDENATISGKVKKLLYYDDGRPFAAFTGLVPPPG